MTVSKQSFSVNKAGYILGTFYAKGDSVSLSPRQADVFLRENRIVTGEGKPKAFKLPVAVQSKPNSSGLLGDKPPGDDPLGKLLPGKKV